MNEKQIHQMRYQSSLSDKLKTPSLMHIHLARDPRQRHKKNFCRILRHRRRQRRSPPNCQARTLAKTKRKAMLRSLLRNLTRKRWCQNRSHLLIPLTTFQSSLWVRRRIPLPMRTLLVRANRLRQIKSC